MKIRNGFVSNSSSSSFIIYKKDLTCAQIQLIHSHSDVAVKCASCGNGCQVYNV